MVSSTGYFQLTPKQDVRCEVETIDRLRRMLANVKALKAGYFFWVGPRLGVGPYFGEGPHLGMDPI